MNGNVFKIQSNMLPDLGRSLKNVLLYINQRLSFEDNSVGNNFHLRI